MRRSEIQNEMATRAHRHLPQTHLVADYYRVRRKVAYPIPVREMTLPDLPVSGLTSYPWATWMTWGLEERIGALGWAGTWLVNEEMLEAAERDLSALASWPTWRQYEQPDLSLGHSGRTLWSAYSKWDWLSQSLRNEIESAFERMLDDGLPLSEEKHAAFQKKEDVLSLENPHTALHNIPIIGTFALALAADALGHAAAPVLNQRLLVLMESLLDFRERGFTEGVAYDGYVMDFAASWMALLPEVERRTILEHPRFEDYLTESVWMGAPGNVARVAELSDVEPVEMTFHISAHATLQRLQPTTTRAWYLSQCPVEWLRTDALATLYDLEEGLTGSAPLPGSMDARYALVLRTGWEAGDVAVAASMSNSPMGHLQRDTGTIVIGTAGRWLLSDPGYQQYLQRKEREFTLGAAAHNVPVINGESIAQKPANRSFRLFDPEGDVQRLEVDIGDCYPAEFELDRVQRQVLLVGTKLVIVADRIAGKQVVSVNYHWTGDAEAAWWVEEGAARVYTPEASMRVASPQVELSFADVDRVPGSRGHLTLSAEVDPSAPVIWWVFAIGEEMPPLELMGDGSEVAVGGRTFRMKE